MDFNDQYAKNLPPKYPSAFPFLTPNNIIAIFTTLSILLRMKKQLGLEAMIEYIEFYIMTIEKHNPRFKGAIDQALEMISVRKIYNAMNTLSPHDDKNSKYPEETN